MRIVISAPAEVYRWESDQEAEVTDDDEYEDQDEADVIDEDDEEYDGEYEDEENELSDEEEEAEEDEEEENDDEDEEIEEEDLDDGEELDEDDDDEETDEEEEDAEEITDTDVLISLSDVEFDGEKFSERLFVEPGTEVLEGVGVKNGTLCFEYSDEDQKLWGYTDYDVPRELNDDELQALIDFTLEQWSDGLGHQFVTDYADETGYFIEMAPPDDEVDFYYEAE